MIVLVRKFNLLCAAAPLCLIVSSSAFSCHGLSIPLRRIKKDSARIRSMAPLFSEKGMNSEGIVLKNAFDSDRASLLASAFDALADDEKYDAVLTGLCSKIINGKMEVDPQQIGKEATLKPSQIALEQLKDPLRLVEEMNQRKIKASSRSLMALIDVSLGGILGTD